ncbi:MAG: hypothetical protein AABX69_05440 [Nanoarchaeota archaeon]
MTGLLALISYHAGSASTAPAIPTKKAVMAVFNANPSSWEGWGLLNRSSTVRGIEAAASPEDSASLKEKPHGPKSFCAAKYAASKATPDSRIGRASETFSGDLKMVIEAATAAAN